MAGTSANARISVRNTPIISAFVRSTRALPPAGNAKYFLEALAIVARQRDAQVVELGAVTVEFGSAALSRLARQMSRHSSGMAGGDARKVAEPGGGKGENRSASLAHRQIRTSANDSRCGRWLTAANTGRALPAPVRKISARTATRRA